MDVNDANEHSDQPEYLENSMERKENSARNYIERIKQVVPLERGKMTIERM